MPCLTNQYDPSKGLILEFAVSRPKAAGDPKPAQVKASRLRALIDTGATVTCISRQAAEKIDLKVMGKTEIQTASDKAQLNVYLADLHIPFGKMIYTLEGTPIVEFNKGESDFDVLLGRDIICQGVLHINFAGFFTFCL